ncbi:hypothetical protein ACHAXS_010175 [Conticribra weissflogii]
MTTTTSPESTPNWKGEVWIQDQWTQDEKELARRRLQESKSSSAPSREIVTQGEKDFYQIGHECPHNTHHLQQQQQQQQHLKPQQSEKQKRALQEFRLNASTNWNAFYEQNQTNFFKDRHYLHKAFPNEFGWLYSFQNDQSPSEESEHISDETGVSTRMEDSIFCKKKIDSKAQNPSLSKEESTKDEMFGHDHNNNNNGGIVRIVEIGCGVGNAILPLLDQHSRLMTERNTTIGRSDKIVYENNKSSPNMRPNRPPQLHIHCLDFAPTAIELLQQDARFKAAAEEGRATAHVYDLSSMHPSDIFISPHTTSKSNNDNEHARTNRTTATSSESKQTLANSADIAILLYCLSAIGPHPSPALSRAAHHAMDMLKPGGTLVIRDYGRLDEAQMKLGTGTVMGKVMDINLDEKHSQHGNNVQFTQQNEESSKQSQKKQKQPKDEKELSDNFYRKGDGTGCYYFELDDLRDLFVNESNECGNMELLELDYIQRIYRNRGEGTMRRRVWIQARFRKPLLCHGTERNVLSQEIESGQMLIMKNRLRNLQRSSDQLDWNAILELSIAKWNERYKILSSISQTSKASSSARIATSVHDTSNLFQKFPAEFLPWNSMLNQDSSKRKGSRRRPPPSAESGAETIDHGDLKSWDEQCSLRQITIVDLGCGFGNETLLNLVAAQQMRLDQERHQNQEQLEQNAEQLETKQSPPKVIVHFLDASKEAIRGLQNDPRYQKALNSEKCEKTHSTSEHVSSHVFDLTNKPNMFSTQLSFNANFVLLQFTLSTVGPNSIFMKNAVINASNMLQKGGVLLFRDFGRYDDDQLQLNSVVGARLDDNFYVRGFEEENDETHDGTREVNSRTVDINKSRGGGPAHSLSMDAPKGTVCYFFDLEEVRKLFMDVGLEVIQLEYVTRVHKKSAKNGTANGANSRKRIWVHGRFRKP